MTLDDLALLYRVSAWTIRRGLQNGTFRPRPWDRYPYRWQRSDVIADLARRRDDELRRGHGFAARPRPARATLAKPAARRSPAR
jgi:hypothetical protein